VYRRRPRPEAVTLTVSAAEFPHVGPLAGSGETVLQLLMQMAQLPLQQFDLLLLSVNSEIDFFHQVLG
jgi:hypothetical protein